ncbi:MAG: hypothetical protein HYV28_01310 [Ignavibacteriales bacterium]|nr:hypothetical protein [Ignavibacteriales bacterium]
MQIASIDIGTNTVILYIAGISVESERIKTITNSYTIPRIGKNVGTTGLISQEKILRLIEILNSFQKEIVRYDCEIVLAGGTYPFRTAENVPQVIAAIKEQTGITIDILSPETEAAYSFLGASYIGSARQKPVVIDIGGGSTEISYGASRILLYRKSVPFGAVNLTEKFFTNGIVSPERIAALQLHVRDVLCNEFSIDFTITNCLAIAGTPTTLAAMNAGLLSFDEMLIDGRILTKNEIDFFIPELASLSPAEVLQKYGSIVAGREDVLLAGTIILSEILRFLKIPELQVNAKGLRHGAVFEYCFKTFGKYFELLY